MILVAVYGLCFGQGQFGFLNSAHFARSIALGDAYTGVAEGIETTYFNSAGLGDIDELTASYSNGDGWATESAISASDIAFILPLQRTNGSLAFSYNKFKLNNLFFSQSLYRLHFGENVADGFSLGGSINYYRTNLMGEAEGNAYDLSLSALLKVGHTVFPALNDEFKTGIQFQNVLGSQVRYNNDHWSEPLFQAIRAGFCYKLTPIAKQIFHRDFLNILLAMDVAFEGARYNFAAWQPNFGIELGFVNSIYIRYGRESKFNETYASPQFPANRFGLGVKLPVSDLLGFDRYFALLMDYSYSSWINSDNEYFKLIKPRHYAFTFQIVGTP